MKNGAYQLHVLIETGKNMMLDGEDTIDPMVKILFMGSEKQTTAKNDISRSSQVKWDEHIFLETAEVKAAEIQEENLVI
jgi:hypothetical protein